MISVLIATYNWNIVLLVEQLLEQFEIIKTPYEVICIDDASNSNFNVFNEQINSFKNCSFETLSKHRGRSGIRNLLAKKAKYKWLLFLDADTLPVSSFFIQNYLKNIQQNTYKVFLGGIAYKNDKNKSRLRWKIGKKGEEIKAERRNKNPYSYFFTANFLIEKAIFEFVFFDESLTKYGYEDLLFAKELQGKNIAIKHIDNSIFHLGIDTNQIFLDKTKLALQNSLFLLKSGKLKKEDTKIFSAFFYLKKLGITNVLNWFLPFFEKKLQKKSSLLYYHFFRWAYLHQIFKNFK